MNFFISLIISFHIENCHRIMYSFIGAKCWQIFFFFFIFFFHLKFGMSFDTFRSRDQSIRASQTMLRLINNLQVEQNPRIVCVSIFHSIRLYLCLVCSFSVGWHFFLLQSSFSIYGHIICYCEFSKRRVRVRALASLLVFIAVTTRFFGHLVPINAIFMVFSFEIQNPSGLYKSSIVNRVESSRVGSLFATLIQCCYIFQPYTTNDCDSFHLIRK